MAGDWGSRTQANSLCEIVRKRRGTLTYCSAHLHQCRLGDFCVLLFPANIEFPISTAHQLDSCPTSVKFNKVNVVIDMNLYAYCRLVSECLFEY